VDTRLSLFNLVNLPEIYTETVRPVLLLHHDNGWTPGTTRWFDDAIFQHFFHLVVDYRCMAGFRGRYRCLIGWSVFSRIRCWSLSVGPTTSSNLASSCFKKSLNRRSSSGVRADSPTESISVGCASVICPSWVGGLKVTPIFAHKSSPIRIGVFKEGIVRNSGTISLAPIVTGSVTAPKISAEELFARRTVRVFSWMQCLGTVDHFVIDKRSLGARIQERTVWLLPKFYRDMWPR